MSSISLYKLDTDKLTAPFESAHQFTLVCTVSDSKTVPGCHYNLCSNHSFVLTNSYLSLFRAVFSLPGLFLPLLYTDLCLLQPWSEMIFFVLRALRKCSCHDRDSPALLDPPPMIEFLELHACSVTIKGRHALKCMESHSGQNYTLILVVETNYQLWILRVVSICPQYISNSDGRNRPQVSMGTIDRRYRWAQSTAGIDGHNRPQVSMGTIDHRYRWAQSTTGSVDAS